MTVCKRCGGKFNSTLDYHRCPPLRKCITCEAEFFTNGARCNDCEEILSNFILGQRKMKEEYENGNRGGLKYT